MSRRVLVASSQPLRYLHAIGQIDLLGRSYERVLVPTAAGNELALDSEAGKDIPRLASLPFIEFQAPQDAPPESLLRYVSRADAEAIMLGQESEDRLVLLEPRGSRRASDSEGIRCTGIAGLLLKARKDGELDSIKVLLPALARAGLKFSPKAEMTVLMLAGEL